MSTEQEYQEAFAEMREVLSGVPSREAWGQFWEIFEHHHGEEPERVEIEWPPYAVGQLERWPDYLRWHNGDEPELYLDQERGLYRLFRRAWFSEASQLEDYLRRPWLEGFGFVLDVIGERIDGVVQQVAREVKPGRRLRGLDLYVWGRDERLSEETWACLEALAEDAHLEVLWIDGVRGDWRPVLERPGCDSLREVSVSRVPGILSAMAPQPWLPRLEHVQLDDCGIGRVALRLLAPRPPEPCQWRSLDLRRNPLRTEEMLRLLASPWSASLRELKGVTQLGDALVQGLLALDVAARLEPLRVSSALSAETLDALLESETVRCFECDYALEQRAEPDLELACRLYDDPRNRAEGPKVVRVSPSWEACDVALVRRTLNHPRLLRSCYKLVLDELGASDLVSAVVGSELARCVRSLELEAWEGSAERLAELCASEFKALRRLYIKRGGALCGRLAELLGAAWIAQLRELDLIGVPLTMGDIEALTRCEALARDDKLDLYLDGHRLSREALLYLARSPFLARLHWLGLYRQSARPTLDEEVLEAFRRSALGGASPRVNVLV